MRRLSCILLAALMGVACAAKQSVLPRTLWERKIRTDKRRLQMPSEATSSTEELRALLNINEGTLAAFGSVTDKLFKSIDFGAQLVNDKGEDNGMFNKMFKTFKIMQQAPAYKDALEQGLDLTDKAVQAKVLASSVEQLTTWAYNMRSSFNKDAEATDGINGKVLEFLSKGDVNTLELAAKVQAGDSGALRQLQQSFTDWAYPGLNLEALMDDDFIKAARSALIKDEGLQALMNNEENTLDLLLDEDLLFKNNPIYKNEL